MDARRRIPWPAPTFFSSRPLLCGALCIAVGISLARVLPYGWWGWGTAVAFGGAAALLWPWRRVAVPLALAGLLALGLARGGLALRVPEMPALGKWQVEGTVDGAPTHNGRGQMLFLRDLRVLPEGGEWTPVDGLIYVYYPTERALPLAHGQRVSVAGTSYAPSSPRNPGGFDQKMWLAQKGAHVRLYADSAPKVLAQARSSIRGLALSVNASLGARMDRVFGAASPVVRAMLLGDQTAMPDEWSQWMRDSGIAHLLAVSGLHVALWYAMLARMLRPLSVSPGVRWWILAGLLAAYALLTGLKPSVLRAVVMLLAVQGAQVARRKPDTLTNLALAAAVILLARPLDLFGAGFQLSFCAVLGIVLLRPALVQGLPIRPNWLRETLWTTVSAQGGILPAGARWFGATAVVGALANIAAIPLTGLLIPVAALGTALDATWPPLGWLFVEASRGMVGVLMLLARGAAALPLANAPLGAFAPWAVAVFFACLLLCCTAVVWRWRTRAAAMAGAIALAVGIGFLSGSFLVQYVQLDVGQALSGVLHVGTKTYVYDTGDEGSDLTEYLLYTGNGIDGLFLSHPHRDHIGGITEALDSGIRIGTVYVPANATVLGSEGAYEARLAQAVAQGAAVVEVAAGDVLDLNGLTATVLAPERDIIRGSGANDRSIVLLVEIGERLLMLMGDADGAAEPLGWDTDVLQVAHHGSANAARDAFLADATPDIALVSTGRNSYGHPNGDTLRRLADAGAQTYITRDSGAITVFFAPGGIRVEEYCR